MPRLVSNSNAQLGRESAALLPPNLPRVAARLVKGSCSETIHCASPNHTQRERDARRLSHSATLETRVLYGETCVLFKRRVTRREMLVHEVQLRSGLPPTDTVPCSSWTPVELKSRVSLNSLRFGKMDRVLKIQQDTKNAQRY